jgi:sialic acid synthase SpsE
MVGFSIAGRTFDSRAPLVIAEIGTGHGGDAGKAAELIAAAAESGAGCAKFQCVFADEIIHPKTGLVPLPGGPTPLFEVFRALERDHDFYARLKEMTETRGLIFLCTPFGRRSAELLWSIGARAMKIASPELNHLPLLDQLAGYGLPVILSSGVSTLADIEAALAVLDGVETALLHCVTAYPAPPEDYNLRLLSAYATLFGVPLGVSDHSLDPVLVPSLAVASGAAIVEKHLCLSRSDPGLDDPIALDPADFSRMRRAIAAAATDPEGSIEGLRADFGADIVSSTLGDGRKRLAPSEEANYGRTNRSIHALGDIARGELFSEANLALLRTEKVLRPGLRPRDWEVVVGRRAATDIPAGEGLRWEDVGAYSGFHTYSIT